MKRLISGKKRNQNQKKMKKMKKRDGIPMYEFGERRFFLLDFV